MVERAPLPEDRAVLFRRILVELRAYAPSAANGARTARILPIGKTGVGKEGVTCTKKSRGVPGAPPAGNVGVNESVHVPGEFRYTVVGPQTNGVPVQVSVEGSAGAPAAAGGVAVNSNDETAGLLGLRSSVNPN